MKPKEALHQHVSPDITKRWPQPVMKAVLAAIKTYHREQVKKCDLGDVVKSVTPKKVNQELYFERLSKGLCPQCGSANQQAGAVIYTCLDCGHVETCL
jgi:tRNA(Ile2) C34 agmatinyltransferase TiaS